MGRQATLTLDSTPGNIRTARHFATRLVDLVMPERALRPTDVQALELMVSELVSNAVEHGTGPVTVQLRAEGVRLRVEIADDAPGAPRRRFVMPGALSGRGLEIVEQLAAAWGWEPTPGGGKLVWFEY